MTFACTSGGEFTSSWPTSTITSPGRRLSAPAGLPSAAGSYIRVDIAADHTAFPGWKQPVRVFFLRQGTGWKLVGLERMPAAP